MSHQVFIGVGSNLSNPQVQCALALEWIAKIPQSQFLQTSSFYQTEPLEVESNKDTPWYVNAVCEISTQLTPEQLFVELTAIEKKMGRVRAHVRGAKWESRVIDLDILAYSNEIIRTDQLTIPHPEIAKRLFVLEPWKEIAPQWIHPVLNLSVEKIRESCQDRLKISRLSQ